MSTVRDAGRLLVRGELAATGCARQRPGSPPLDPHVLDNISRRIAELRWAERLNPFDSAATDFQGMRPYMMRWFAT